MGTVASIYQRPASAFWWIKFRDPVTSKILRESTGFRVGVGADTRKAQELEAVKTLAERQGVGEVIGKWDLWVKDFITDQTADATRERYLSGWRTLRMFLEEQDVPCPRALTYDICSGTGEADRPGYLKWRAIPNKRKGKYNAGKNTAILEVKILRWIMREAVKRGYAVGNPAREVVLKRAPRKVFPDYSDDQLQEIMTAINTEPEPERTQFKRSFVLSLLQGVRLNETNVNPMTAVKFAGEIPTIRFLQKGGKERVKPLHPQLIPLFKQLQSENKTQTYAMDKYTTGASKGRLRWGNRWTKFWRRHSFKDAIPNACFHSIRVTVENVLREAGVAKEIRECYLSHEHSNQDVNASYDRVKIREMLVCHTPLQRSWLKL